MPKLPELDISAHHSLKSFNSFGFSVNADFLVSVDSQQLLLDALDYARENSLSLIVLGEGSNVVLRQDINGLILKMAIRGIRIVEQDDSSVVVRVGAGENWHDFVLWCLRKGFYGLENLSLIPGGVGAAPIQNIGAYGVEQCDCFTRLQAVNRETGELIYFDKSECEFDYRESVFKGKYLDKFIITRVEYRLSKQANTHTGYGAIKEELSAMNADPNDPVAVSAAVCNIRRSKLPSPQVIGNAGSFFKNPVIDVEQYEQLKIRFKELVAYPEVKGKVKIAAGWMIESCGWKGFRKGDIGVHVNQALVLVNYGTGKGADLIELATRIQNSVRDKFGIILEIEPRIYPAINITGQIT